jgi:hypothetical protein
LTTTLTMPVAPRIRVAPGAPVPIRHSDRIIAEMLRYIAREHAGTFSRVIAAIKGDRCGGPKAQARTVERVRRIAGETLLDVQLTPGKRGHFKIALADWVAWHEGQGCEIGPDDPLPLKPWLACGITFVEGKGGGRRSAKGHYSLMLTHHSLSRLAQRAGVRSVPELIGAVRAVWGAYYDFRLRSTPGTPTPTGTHLPFKLASGREAVAITKRYPDGGSLVVTVIDAPRGGALAFPEADKGF